MEVETSREQLTQLRVDPPYQRHQAGIILERRLRLTESIPFVEDCLRRYPADGRHGFAEQLRGERRCRFPCAASRQQVVANVVEETVRNLLDCVVEEGVFDGVVVVKIADLFDRQFFKIETCCEGDLSTQFIGLGRLLGLRRSALAIPPLGDGAAFTKPSVVPDRVISRKTA